MRSLIKNIQLNKTNDMYTWPYCGIGGDFYFLDTEYLRDDDNAL